MRGVVPLWAGGQAGWLSVSRAWKLVKKSEACLRGLAPVLLLCSHMQAPRAAGNRSRPPPVATHPFFHFHMFWCSSEAIRAASDPALFPFPPSASELAAANHWVLVLQTTALESLCATTVPDSSTRLKNTAQGSLSSLSSLCIRRWLAVCSSSRSPAHSGLANPQEPLHAG